MVAAVEGLYYAMTSVAARVKMWYRNARNYTRMRATA